VGGTIELPWQSDVARSFESGTVRSWITSGHVTATIVHGTADILRPADVVATEAAFVVDLGTPGSCYVAMDNGGGVSQTPGVNDTYTFNIGGALTTLTGVAAAANEDQFTIGANGTTAAAALKNAINAHSTIGLRLVATLAGTDAIGLRYVVVRTILAADIYAGTQVTCTVNDAGAGVVVARNTAIASGKYALRHVRYAVNAQDMFLAGGAGEVKFDLGFTTIVWAQVIVRTTATNATQIAWAGKVVIAGGVVTVDNSGATDFAANNVLEVTIYGKVA